MSKPSDYGNYYWCVKVPKHLNAETGEIYVHADRTEIKADGSVIFYKEVKDEGVFRINFALAAGQWYVVYAASCLDGHPVAVTHWTGEIA